MQNDNEVLKRCVEHSELVSWKISELLPDDYKISYQKKFLPSSISQEDNIPFLNEHEKKRLNQIIGAAYFNIFAFVEEYILLFTLNFANDSSFAEPNVLRAYVRFSEEEIKHQMLFDKYINLFKSSFGSHCEFVSNAHEVASAILSNTQLCVLLLTYHLELITQQHFVESSKSKEDLDDKFSEILKNHWLEEAQHSKLDLYKIEQISKETDESEFNISLNEYFSILDTFVVILKQQADMNYQSIKATSSQPDKFDLPENKKSYQQIQYRAYVELFIIKGLENPIFQKNIKRIWPNSLASIQAKVDELRARYSA